MTFDFNRTDHEAVEADLEPVARDLSRQEPSEEGVLVRAVPPASYSDRFALIERLARQLALAQGEDPDEQPFPLRHPRWRFHCGRAKVLLAITPAEHRALAAIFGEGEGRTRSMEPDTGARHL